MSLSKIFEEVKGFKVVHNKYSGIVCGYNNEHFILAVETTNDKFFFRRLPQDSFILPEYKDSKYRYIYEDEREIIKQINYAKFNV